MADQSSVPFPLRQNTNGTFDVICPRCFRTVASEVRESQIEEMTHIHTCDERQWPFATQQSAADTQG